MAGGGLLGTLVFYFNKLGKCGKLKASYYKTDLLTKWPNKQQVKYNTESCKVIDFERMRSIGPKIVLTSQLVLNYPNANVIYSLPPLQHNLC